MLKRMLIVLTLFPLFSCGGGAPHFSGPLIITSDNIQNVVIKIVEALPEEVGTPDNDGRGGDYEIINTELTGDNESGYNITATLRFKTSTNIEFSIDNLIFCENDYPMSGDMTISDGESEATVEFTSCIDYMITFDDVDTFHEW